MKRGKTKRLICVLSAVVIALGSSAQVLALLAPDAAASQETIMEYVNAYDHDSAFILQEGIDSGDDIPDWYVEGDSFLDHLDTAVHEECHAFTHGNFWGSMKIYAGDGESFKVKESKIFDTVKMAKEIPEELRTFRYDDYIGEKADKIMGSRQSGAYGLLDELNAYSWGLNSDIAAYSYLEEAGADPETWQKVYIVNGYNNTMAQTEFDFWILRYMVYAKENEPSVYKKLMKNDDFIRAYLSTRSRFEALTQKYFDSLPELEELLNSNGYHVEIDDNVFKIVNDDMSTLSYSVRDTDRDKLIGEIQKPEYQEILSEMRDVVPDAESCVADQSSGDPGAGEEADGRSEDSGEDAVGESREDSDGEIQEDSDGDIQEDSGEDDGGGIKGILHKALRVLKTVWDMALDFLGWLWEKVTGIFGPLWERISGLLPR